MWYVYFLGVVDDLGKNGQILERMGRSCINGHALAGHKEFGDCFHRSVETSR